MIIKIANISNASAENAAVMVKKKKTKHGQPEPVVVITFTKRRKESAN